MLSLCSATTAANYHRYPNNSQHVCLYGQRHSNMVPHFANPRPLNAFVAAEPYSEEYQLKMKPDVFAGINESLSALVCNTDTAITNTFKSLQLAIEALNHSLDASLNSFKLSFTTGLSTGSTIAANGIATAARGAYASLKDILPPDLQNVFTSSEDALRQLYIGFQGFEKSVGIDPSDPILPFLILLGTSTTLWVSYWRFTYAGYAGDLSPKITLDLLSGKETVALVDVRPEESRERDGIPDLRRGARFRYATVPFPEVDNTTKKLLMTGKELDDTLIAAVIRNLKLVQGGSKVVVMDVDGSRSKGIARALRKLGIKKPYLVQGGFRSWVQEGLRVKEPKPETTFTILNEEAEAILEDVTPLQVLGYGAGFVAAAYALLEWETTLQLIAIFGLSLTIYRRVASYENSKDFNRDVRQLLVPVKMGGQAISWAAGKLETNRNGLPTLPSSVNVQSRVLQAAAKHGSQPPDPEGEEQTTSSVSPKPDLSEV